MNEQSADASTEPLPSFPNSPSVLAALRAVPGLGERLARGIHVVDVGCGWGASTVTMAAAFPLSRFLGVEPDEAIVERARRLTTARRLRNVYWVAASAHQLAPWPTHDLICAFDGVHDMCDPRGALRAIHAALADDAVYLWAEASGHQADVRELAKATGFSRVLALRVDDPLSRFFALRK
jgi:trans-aconitate methyltransferase